jgi:hypothetical protein
VNRCRHRFARSFSAVVKFAVICATVLVAAGWAQNPVPQIVGPVKPMAVAPGSGAFTLSVYGANFVPGAVVTWNRQAPTTTFISGHELQAQIPASDVAQNTAGLIGVTNPAPGGGKASTGWAQVEVHAPMSTVTVSDATPYPIGDWLLMGADFNNDGILDLIGEFGGDLEFYAGTGHGTFHFGSIAGRNYTGVLPGVYGDFNGDGNLDLVFPQDLNVNNQPTHMAVMLGDGKGKFHLGSRLRDLTGFGLTVVGDFNGDGKLDLVTKGERRFSVFLGNGDGTLQRFRNYPYINLTTDMATGDFNGDGKLDLLLLLVGGKNNGVLLNLLMGNGDGTFQNPRVIGSFPNTTMCGVGDQRNFVSDFNGDGKLDIVFCTQTQVVIMLGNGDGTSQPPRFVDTGTQGQFSFAVGDINSDGKPDLIVSNYFNFNNPELDVYLGNGDGTFQQPQSVSLAGGSETAIILGDFNSDGLLDLSFPTGLGMRLFMQQ